MGLRLIPGRRPDLYIPTMGYLTFVLMHGLCKGTDFHPDDLYNIASMALLLGGVEVLFIKGAAYILNVPTLTLTDIAAVCGYKFTNLSAVIMLLMVFSGRAIWIALYLFAAGCAGLVVQKGLIAVGSYNHQHFMGTSSVAMEKLIALCAGAAQMLWCWILMPAFTEAAVGTFNAESAR